MDFVWDRVVRVQVPTMLLRMQASVLLPHLTAGDCVTYDEQMAILQDQTSMSNLKLLMVLKRGGVNSYSALVSALERTRENSGHALVLNSLRRAQHQLQSDDGDEPSCQQPPHSGVQATVRCGQKVFISHVQPHFKKLLNEMRPVIVAVWLLKTIMTWDDLEVVLDKPNATEQSRKVLDIVRHHGNRGVWELQQVLRGTKQGHLAQLIQSPQVTGERSDAPHNQQSWLKGSSQLREFQNAYLTLENSTQSSEEAEAIVMSAQEHDVATNRSKLQVGKAASEDEAGFMESKSELVLVRTLSCHPSSDLHSHYSRSSPELLVGTGERTDVPSAILRTTSHQPAAVAGNTRGHLLRNDSGIDDGGSSPSESSDQDIPVSVKEGECIPSAGIGETFPIEETSSRPTRSKTTLFEARAQSKAPSNQEDLMALLSKGIEDDFSSNDGLLHQGVKGTSAMSGPFTVPRELKRDMLLATPNPVTAAVLLSEEQDSDVSPTEMPVQLLSKDKAVSAPVPAISSSPSATSTVKRESLALRMGNDGAETCLASSSHGGSLTASVYEHCGGGAELNVPATRLRGGNTNAAPLLSSSNHPSSDYDIRSVHEELVKIYQARQIIPSMNWLNKRPLRIDTHIVNISLLDADQAVRLGLTYGNPGLQHQAFSMAAVHQMKLEGFLDRVSKFQDRRYLAFGPPGVGKTVAFCHKLPFEWAWNRTLKKFNLVFIVPLRERLLATTTSPAELLLSRIEYLRDNVELRDRIYKEIQRYSEQIMVILDGLDEVRDYSMSTAFMRLLNREVLELSTVIATSRPCHLASVVSSNIADQCIEVVGFTDSDVKEFITKQLSDQEKADKLITVYEEEPSINDLMRVPLLALVLTFLCSEEERIDSFVSELYCTLFRNWLGYHRAAIEKLRKTDEASAIPAELQHPDEGVRGFRDMRSVDGHIQGLMFRLGKLALDQLVADTDQLVFDVELTKKYRVGLAVDLGLLMHCEVANVTSGLQESVQFPHLTFQEFLACVYLASLEGPTQCSLIELCVEKLGHDENMKMFWLFLAGLSSSKAVDDIVHKLAERLNKTKLSTPVEQSFVSLTLQVLHEAFHGCREDDEVVGELVSQLVQKSLPSPSSISFANRLKLRSNETAALSFCLQHCTAVKKLDLANCDIDKTSMALLVPGLKSVTHFTLDRNFKLAGEAVRCLCREMRWKQLPFEELSFYQCKLKPHDGYQLAAALQRSRSLRVLKLNWNEFDDQVATRIGAVLRNNHELSELNMTRTELGGEGAKHLLEAVAVSKHMRSVGLSQNKIDDVIGPALGQLLLEGHYPRAVHLHKNKLTGKCLRDAARIIDELTPPTGLGEAGGTTRTELSLIDNDFVHEDMAFLADAMTGKSIAKVNFGESVIENGRLQDTDVRALLNARLKKGRVDLRYVLGCRGMHRLKSVLLEDLSFEVRDLRLRNNKLIDEAFVVMAEILVESVDIEYLSVYDNLISSNGVTRFCQKLLAENACNLRCLNLGRNDLSGTAGTTALAHLLRSSSIEFVGLYFCSLGDSDVRPLLDTLRMNRKLRFIDLGNNNLTERTLEQLLSVVQHNSTLQYIQLGNNKLGLAAVQTAVSRFRANTRLKQVWLGGNDPPLPETVFGGCLMDGYCSYNEYPLGQLGIE